VQEVFAGRIFKTRGGAVLLGGAAAVLAAILLVVYLHSYRSSVNSGTRPITVLVAKSLIPRGTSGSLIAQEGLYQVTTVPKSQLKNLAIADPGALNDRVTVADVYPGQQLTANDFTTEGVNSIPNRITGNKRAIAIPVDGTHAVAGQLQAGDRVDVYVGFNTQQGTGTGTAAVIKLIASNVLVLAVPTSSGGGFGAASNSNGANAVLRVSASMAAKFAFAADNGRLWLVLRPQVGAKPTPPSLVTAAQLLAGQPAVGG
jgi:Flp pilus assembly protein CpaB